MVILILMNYNKKSVAEKIFNLSDKIIKAGFYLLFLLVPLILTPWNYELFEFSKMISVYCLTTIIVAAWLMKMITSRKFIFRRSFWDIPLLIFFFSQLLSTIFSLDPHTSIWGYYTRAHGGLASTICYLLLYWAFTNNMAEINTSNGVRLKRSADGTKVITPPRWVHCIRIILISALLVAGYGVLEHFGIDKNYWVQDVQNRVFSTLGQPNWLAAYLTALIFIPISLVLSQNQTGNTRKKSHLPLTAVYYLLFTIFYLCLIFTKSRSGLLAFGVAYLVFWVLIFLVKTKSNTIIKIRQLLIFSFIVLALTSVTNNPAKDWLLIKLNIARPVEKPEWVQISSSGDIRKIVWQGAVEIWRHYPLLGSGVETFAYSYYNYRPVEHNLVSEWDFLYNKAHNEFLNFLATSGIVGLGSYLLLIGSFIYWSLKKLKVPDKKPFTLNRNLHLALLSGFTSILITNFLGFSVVSVGLFFFLFPAISFATTEIHQRKKIKLPNKINLSQHLLIGVVILFTLTSLLFILQSWYADYWLAKADQYHSANYYQQAFDAAQKAVNLRPDEPVYHDELALEAAALAEASFLQKEATLAAQMALLAIKQSDKALTISPYHLNFWKNRTRIFLRLAEIDPGFHLEALKTLIKTSELAPTDAKIFYNLALLYKQLDQTQTALATLQKTIQMKPNYKEARFALALYLQEQGKKKEALEQLEYIIEKIDPQDEEIKKLIDNWQKIYN